MNFVNFGLGLVSLGSVLLYLGYVSEKEEKEINESKFQHYKWEYENLEGCYARLNKEYLNSFLLRPKESPSEVPPKKERRVSFFVYDPELHPQPPKGSQ